VHPLRRATQEAISGAWRERAGATAAARKAIVAPIAAGEQVVVSTKSDTYDLIRSRYDRAVAVEMEGSGFLRAAYANQDVMPASASAASQTASNSGGEQGIGQVRDPPLSA